MVKKNKDASKKDITKHLSETTLPVVSLKEISDKEETSKLIESFKESDLNGKLIVIKVGSVDHLATQEDINDITNQFTEVLEETGLNCRIIVTHHLIDIKTY